ncbi:MAG: tetratricopeptide repeat protein [Candidatus Hodarchaeales archaeon]|jgi:tetratricopeptide (TPR) repeat protein
MKAGNANRRNDPKKALEYAKNAKDMLHKLDDSYLEIYLTGQIAYAQYLDGNIDTSIDLHKQRLNLAESKNYPFISQHSLLNLCYAYQIQGDLTKALEAGHKGLTIWQSLQQRNPDLQDNEALLINLGEVYRVKGDFEKALLYLKQRSLSLLGTQVTQIQQQLESEFLKAQELIQYNAPLQKRIEQSKLDLYLKEIQKTIKF